MSNPQKHSRRNITNRSIFCTHCKKQITEDAFFVQDAAEYCSVRCAGSHGVESIISWESFGW